MTLDEFGRQLKIKKLRGRPLKHIRLTRIEIMILEKHKIYRKRGYLFILEEKNGNKD
jgi:hypothetical protein